jgi:type II secretory pathway pseudopilin PulG
MNASKTRRWLWYGLTAVIALVIILAAGLFGSYRLWKSRQQAQQRAAAEAVEALGGTGQLVYSSLSPLSFYLESGDAPNLFFLNSTGVTDDDLVVFESAPTTRGLNLFDNQITDDGLRHLSNLPELDFLDLRRNNITDAGLVHLEKLSKLKNLYLIRTRVSPSGISKLQKKLPNTKIAH